MPTTLAVRVSHYDGPGAQRLREDLTHLEQAARSADASLPWLAEHGDDGRFRLVTASLDGRLVGYVAGLALADRVEVQRLLTVPAAADAEPELSDALVDTLIAVAGTPCTRVALPGDSRALGHLVHVGWRPVAVDSEHPHPEGMVVLEHSGARRHG